MLIVDSQAVKNTSTAGTESKGYCFYKSTNGIKRHLAVDTLGLPFFTHCTKANVADDIGLVEMFKKNLKYFAQRTVDMPKLTVLMDSGYHVEHITTLLKNECPSILGHIDLKISPKVSREKKELKGEKGFIPIAKRWIVERTNSWVEKCRALVKNCEKNLFRSNFKLDLCFTRLMIKKLAK